MFKNLFLGFVFAIAAATSAGAQSACPAPAFAYGQVLTAAQWNQQFACKQATLGYIPLPITGGTLTGPVITTNSTTAGAGLGIIPGIAPTLPNNGDMWVTSLGLYIQINGVTVGPLVGSGSPAVNVPTLTKSANYVVLSADVATGALDLEVDASSGAITITVPVALGTSGASPHIHIFKTDTSSNAVLISDGTNTVDAIVTPATALGQINGWRDIYSNGTNLRSTGVG